MQPKTGNIVSYKLSAADCAAITKQRESGQRGNPVAEGDTYPALVVAVFTNEFGQGVHGLNLKVFLDGDDSFWATSRRLGNKPGEYEL